MAIHYICNTEVISQTLLFLLFFSLTVPFSVGFSCPDKTALVECSAGSYAAAASIKCQPCPKGASCPTNGLSNYFLCSNGTYSDAESLSDCKVCPAGFYCPSVGMEAPEECANGTYSYATGAQYCILCPEGHR